MGASGQPFKRADGGAAGTENGILSTRCGFGTVPSRLQKLIELQKLLRHRLDASMSHLIGAWERSFSRPRLAHPAPAELRAPRSCRTHLDVYVHGFMSPYDL